MKKTPILLLFIFLANLGYSQSFIELNQKALELYKQGKLSESINVGLEALEQCKSNDTSYNYYLSVSNLATYYFENKSYLEALKYYKPTIDLHNKFYGADDLYFFYFNKKAKCLEKIGDLKNAESIYASLLKLSKRFYGDTSNLYNNSLRNLAIHYFQNGDYNKTKPYYIEIKNNAKSFGENSIEYATAINNLGLVYFYLELYDSACISYSTAYDIFNKNDKEIKSDDLIILLDNLALAYDNARNYLDAKRYYEKEIELRNKRNSLDARTNVLTLLASVNLKLKNYDDAINCYKKEIEIKNKYFILDSFDFLLTYENLAYTYELKADSANAFLNYYHALKIRKNIYGETSPEYLDALNILAVKKHNSGNYIQALELYNKAFKIRADINLRLDSGYYYLVKNMSMCYFELKDTLNLNKTFQLLILYNTDVESNKIYNDSLKFLSVNQLYKKADDLYNSGNLKEAIKWAKTALEKSRQVENFDTLSFLNSLSLTGTILFTLGNFKEAEKLYDEEKNKSKAYYSSLSFYYVKSLRQLEILNETIKNYVKAESIIKEILSIQKFVYGDNHPEYADACIQYAQYLLETFQYDNAKQYFDKAGEIYKQKTGVYSQEYADYLTDYASYFLKQNDFINSIKNYTESIRIYKKINKENTSDFIDINEYLADAFQKNADYINAKKQFKLTNDLSRHFYGANSVNYNSFLLSYADFYFKNGYYKEAEDIYLKNVVNVKLNLGERSSEYFRILNNMGLLYQQIGLVNKSDSLFNLSISLIRYNYGELSEEYALSLNNLGLNYFVIGDYKNAEKYLSDAASVRKKIFGENNSDYASSKLNLGNVYMSIGNFKSAENVTKEAASIFQYNNSQEIYATAINNLGLIYFLQEDYTNAEVKFQEALELKRKTIGETHPDYIRSIYSLGLLCLYKQDFSSAEKYLLESLSLCKNKYGELNNNYANGLNTLALLYNQTGRSNDAEELFNKAYGIIRNNLGEKNLLLPVSISGLNMLYENQKKTNQADSLLIRLAEIFKDLMVKNFEFMSMSQSLDFIKSQERNFSFAYSYLSRNANSDAVSKLLDLDLFIRNTTLYNLDKLELIAKKNNDTAFLKKWATYKFYKSTLSKSKPQDNTIEIEKNTEAIEKEIMTELPEYNVAIKNNNINWSDIQNKLKPNDAVISYVSFRYYSNLKLTDSILYAAFILRKDWKQPKYIPLCNEAQLAEILEINNNGESIDRLYNDTTNGLYSSIWRPFDSLFIGVKRIYLSPISMLNKISFSAISLPEGGKLIDKYDIQILANVRSIAEVSKNQTELKSAFLFGDIDYNSEPLTIDKNISYQVADSASFSSLRSLTNGKWGNLNSTGNEVSTIRDITASSKINTTVFTKQNATEENFKNIKTPSIIHIATHGFSLPQPKQNNKADYFLAETQKNIFQKSIDPLTRSGLVMSGGNQMWQKGTPFPNHEDEILTAKEVSDMDLGGCVLAILSACETGLGDVKGSEGVFGLQRAFKMAGVHYLIVSLWKVPDAETADFMQTFYSKWLKDKNEIKDAFRKTQLDMSDKYKEPYKWAGFVLVE